MATKLRVPVDVYLDTPDNEAPYHEYVDGEVIRKAMPDFAHWVLVDEIAFAFGKYRREHGGLSGPEIRTQFQMDDGDPDYRLPDYAFWASSAVAAVEVRGRVYGHPPTLAVEVRSPDESMRSQREKCRCYQNNGVAVVWLIDPATQTVEVFEGVHEATLRAADVLTSLELPGFELAVADLFKAIADLGRAAQ